MKDLKPGTVVIIDYHSKLQQTVNKVVRFVGEIMPLQKWQSNDMINLSTNDPDWPWRILQTKNIISVVTEDDQQITIPKISQTDHDQEWQVESSKKGKFYTVSERDGHMSCTCPGFGFRGNCRHINEVK